MYLFVFCGVRLACGSRAVCICLKLVFHWFYKQKPFFQGPACGWHAVRVRSDKKIQNKWIVHFTTHSKNLKITHSQHL